MEASSKLWGGRFEQEPNKILQDLNSSINIDQELWKQDILVSTDYNIKYYLYKVLPKGLREQFKLYKLEIVSPL